MNERIKELKHQVSVWCDENIPEQFSEETNGYGSAWEEKFAELIVRECGEFCGHDHEGVVAMFKHFGVKE